MYLKDRYLEERLKLYYGLSPKLREYRQQILAPRELETFVKLMKLSNLPEHSSIENRKFLDLGSGDQFLKNVVDPEKIFEIKNESKDCGSYLRYYDLSQPGAK